MCGEKRLSREMGKWCQFSFLAQNRTDTIFLVNQAIERDGGVGVSLSALLDAVRNPVRTETKSGGRTVYVGRNATVVLNSQGQIITTWANGSTGLRGQ